MAEAHRLDRRPYRYPLPYPIASSVLRLWHFLKSGLRGPGPPLRLARAMGRRVCEASHAPYPEVEGKATQRREGASVAGGGPGVNAPLQAATGVLAD